MQQIKKEIAKAFVVVQYSYKSFRPSELSYKFADMRNCKQAGPLSNPIVHMSLNLINIYFVNNINITYEPNDTGINLFLIAVIYYCIFTRKYFIHDIPIVQ